MHFLRSARLTSSVAKTLCNIGRVRAFGLILVCLFVLSSLSFAGVRDDLQKARFFMDKGKFRTSAAILQNIIKRYPDNKIAYYLLARIYYRAGNMRQAARLFRKAGPDVLDGSTAFEFGIALFSVNDCNSALKGLIKVSDPRYKDVASFYTGVCHFRKRDYLRAEVALRHAYRLPKNFNGSKRKLLMEIQRRRRDSGITSYVQQAPYVPLPMPQQQSFYYQQPYYQQQQAYPGLPPGPGAPNPEELTDEAPKKAEAPKPTKGFDYSANIKVEYLSQNDSTSKHARSESTSNRQGPQGAVDVVGHYRLAPDKSGEQTEFNLALNTTLRALGKATTESAVVIDETVGAEPIQTSSKTRSSDRAVTWELKPFVALPIGDEFDMEAGAKYGEELPEMKPDAKSTYAGGYGTLNIGWGDINSKITGEMLTKEKLDAEGGLVQASDQKLGFNIDGPLPFELVYQLSGDYTQTTNTEYGTLDGFVNKANISGGLKRNWDSFGLGVAVTKTVLSQPAEKPVSGASDTTKFAGNVTKTLKIGVTLSAFGEYSLIDQYTKTGLCPADAAGAITSCGENTQVANAVGDKMGYGASLSFAPIEWAYVNASYETRTSTFAVSNKELDADFRKNVVDLQTSFKVLVGVSYGF